LRYSVDETLFTRVPDFCRGVVVGRNCDNTGDAPELDKLLRARIVEVEADPGLGPEDPRIQAWTSIYRNYPAPRGERIRPSIWSLIRRIKRGDGARIPFASPLVAISNLVSLTYLVPSGLVDADRVSGDLALGPAGGAESFLPFGREERVTVEPGEVIYYDDATGEVMCRAWNSRGSRSTGIRPETTRTILDVDGLLGVVPETVLQEATQWAASLVRDHCSGDTQVFYLHAGRSEVRFDAGNGAARS
jgi:DNA/RNA-binding domain of Phe-tRNA-synthetase-like protein